MTEQGVVFPARKAGGRSTTATGKEIVAAALSGADEQASQRVASEANWRKGYRQHFEQMTAAAVESADSASSIARTGLESVHQHFEFHREGTPMALSEAMSTCSENRFETATIHGEGRVGPLTVAYKQQNLSGVSLRGQVAQWRQRGIIEDSHESAVLRVLDHPHWVNEMPPVVLLGAGAEMGPYHTLLELGATVIALDLDRKEIWERLIDTARRSAGTLIFPVSKPQTSSTTDDELAGMAGANLLTDTPEIASWLLGLNRPLTIGGYAYLDGGSFVRVTVAMDAIMAQVTQRSRHPVHLAFLLTPTDCYAVPEEVAVAAQEAFSRQTRFSTLRSLACKVSRSRLFAPNVRRLVEGETGNRYGIINSLVVQQGPNYTLAKRIQRWRSLVAREQGQIVSCNVAPATYTESVTKNRLFAAGYAGAEVFRTEAFEPAASNAMMTAQLINDLVHADSAANPEVRLDNPEELFMEGASHSGFWRMGCQLSSVLEAAVVAGAFKYLGSLRGAKSKTPPTGEQTARADARQQG